MVTIGLLPHYFWLFLRFPLTLLMSCRGMNLPHNWSKVYQNRYVTIMRIFGGKNYDGSNFRPDWAERRGKNHTC